MKKKIQISQLKDNSDAEILMDTRVKGHFWRDEIEFEGMFHFIASSVVDCSVAFDEEYWNNKFLSFESLIEPISFKDFEATKILMRQSFSVFRHTSIHILQKAWEFFSGGGDSYSQVEIKCKGRPYNKTRIFVCKNYHIGTGVFILDGEEWSEYESIFMNKTVDVKVSEIQFSNILDMISTTLDAKSLTSNYTLTDFIEKNFHDKIKNELIDVHLYNEIEAAKGQNLDDVFD